MSYLLPIFISKVWCELYDILQPVFEETGFYLPVFITMGETCLLSVNCKSDDILYLSL